MVQNGKNMSATGMIFEQNIVFLTDEQQANYRSWGSLQLRQKPLNCEKILKINKMKPGGDIPFSCCFIDYRLFSLFYEDCIHIYVWHCASYTVSTQWKFILINGNNNHARWETFNQFPQLCLPAPLQLSWSYWKEKKLYLHIDVPCASTISLSLCTRRIPQESSVSGVKHQNPEALFKTLPCLRCRSLNKSPNVSKMSPLPWLQRLGPPSLVVCHIRWQCIGTNCIDQRNNSALDGLHRVSCICLLSYRDGVWNDAGHIADWMTGSNWIDHLWLIYYSFPKSQLKQSPFPWRLSHRICLTHIHKQTHTFCASAAPNLYLGLILACFLIPPWEQRLCLIHLWAFCSNFSQGGHTATLREGWLQVFK